MKAETRNWLASADYDIESAQAMLKSGRYIYVAFLCHLAVEKTLKAAIRELTDKAPPRIHDLISLLRRSKINLPPDYL